MANTPVPIELLCLRSATTTYVGIAQDCQEAAEALAQAVPGDEEHEPARELVTQLAAALDPDRTGSPAAVLVALRGVMAK
jgi:hypothetical protein